MKCDCCGKDSRSFYVYYKGNDEYGKRCPDCDYKIRMSRELCLRKK